MLKNLFVLVSAGLCSSFLTAETYSHRLDRFGDGKTLDQCRSEIQHIAQAFADSSGKVVLGADCIPSEYFNGQTDGEIAYVAQSRILVFSSDVRSEWRSYSYYATNAACLSGLATEAEIFKNLTHLTPFVSYCYRSNSIGAPTYRARMDAIGMSDIKKFSTISNFMNRLEQPNLVLETVREQAEARDLVIVNMAVIRDISGWHVAMDYYGQDKVYLHAGEKLNFDRIEDCNSASEELHSNWSASTLKIISTCTTNGRKSGLTHLWLSNNLFGEEDFSAKTLPIAYANLAACQGDRNRVVSAMAASGSNVIGSICGFENNQPRILVFVEKIN